MKMKAIVNSLVVGASFSLACFTPGLSRAASIRMHILYE